MSRRNDYPYDYDASLRFSRFSLERTTHPHPSMVGSLSMMLPQYGPHVIQPAVTDSGIGPASQIFNTGVAGTGFINLSIPPLEKVGG